jgi:hypothetical protein
MKKTVLLGLAFLSAAVLGGCATMTKGLYQPVVVSSDPPGASCRIYREDEGLIQFVARTPEKVYIRRGMEPLRVECRKVGFRESSELVLSANDDRVFGNIVTLGAGLLVDLPSKAHRYYPDNISVVLDPL